MAFETHLQELEYLQHLGFATNPLNKTITGVENVWNYAQEIQAQREKLPYQIDGVVVKLNDNILKDRLGVVGKTPRGWAAIKFPPDEVTTKLLGLSWQVGRSGKVTPVADLEPVQLQGTTVKRASLHNYKQVIEMNLCVGDYVVIRKAGDIIPEVIKVVKI